MRPWSLRFKITALVVVLAAGSSLAASAIHGWLAFRAVRDDVRIRAAAVVSDVAFGVTTVQELENRELLVAMVRNIMAARPTLRWLDIYAAGQGGLAVIASSRETPPPRPPDSVTLAVAEARTVTEAGTTGGQEAWLAAAPIRLGGTTVGAVSLALSLEGASRLAAGLWQQLLLVLVAASLTIILGLALFTERSINRPIRTLLDTMAAVERGDLSATPRLTRRDEMGRLGGGLAAMLTRIRESHEENTRLVEQINRFNQDLQQRVTEATQELAKRNEALRRASELLFDLQRELGRSKRLATMGHMAATIAHEIGSPLNSIAVHLQLLARSPGLTAHDRQRLATIDGQIQRLVRTVQDRLSATQGVTRRVEPTDLSALVQGITDLMAPVLAGKGIACRLTRSDELPKVRIDAPEMQQVILNLLTNAVDAMPAGGALAIETVHRAGAAILRVTDSGPGIPAEIRPRIFEPFFTTKAQGKGTGLGLAICRRIVEAHGGSIQVGETPGGGATFEVTLPLPPHEASP
jgi:signal transduction histidine kinase